MKFGRLIEQDLSRIRAEGASLQKHEKMVVDEIGHVWPEAVRWFENVKEKGKEISLGLTTAAMGGITGLGVGVVGGLTGGGFAAGYLTHNPLTTIETSLGAAAVGGLVLGYHGMRVGWQKGVNDVKSGKAKNITFWEFMIALGLWDAAKKELAKVLANIKRSPDVESAAQAQVASTTA